MDAASIEQMNKVRASLGLALLPVPGETAGPAFRETQNGESDGESDEASTLEKRAAAAGDNWQKLEAERQDKVDRQKRKDAAKKARDAAQRFAKLSGKGLGEADDEEEEADTRTWLLRQRKRQAKIERSRKLEEELAAREQVGDYTAKDLAGVRVAHEIDDFDGEAGEQVLTLKDTEIGSQSEDDELENAEIRAKEKLEERLRLKKKRPDYDPTEQEEAKNILSKYDEEIDGKKSKQFTLDGKGTSKAAKKHLAANTEVEARKGVKIDLDMLMVQPASSDYVDPATIKVKKAKKKKDRKTRQRIFDEDDGGPPTPVEATESMDVDSTAANGVGNSKKRALEFDDEDLQAQLAQQRRQALKKRTKMDAAELARQLRDEMPIDDPVPEEGALVIDETSEFVANLKKTDDVDESSRRDPKANKRSRSPSPYDADGDASMQNSYAAVEDAADRDSHVEREGSERLEIEATATGLDDEETTTGGVAGTLAMLRKRGLVEVADAAMTQREASRREFLASKQHIINDFDLKAREQREADRNSGKLAKMSNRERDAYAQKENERREAFVARLLAQKFNEEYRPDVKLEYHDEFGRSMNQKEAFKHMSHMFHGKGSGKQKTEKRLKKIEDERKEMARGVLNIGDEGGMASVQGREGKRQKQAGVRLQ